MVLIIDVHNIRFPPLPVVRGLSNFQKSHTNKSFIHCCSLNRETNKRQGCHKSGKSGENSCEGNDRELARRVMEFQSLTCSKCSSPVLRNLLSKKCNKSILISHFCAFYLQRMFCALLLAPIFSASYLSWVFSLAHNGSKSLGQW